MRAPLAYIARDWLLDRLRTGGNGIELVWGFFRQVVVFGLLPVLCSERAKAFFVPSLAIRFAERAEGVKGPKR